MQVARDMARTIVQEPGPAVIAQPSPCFLHVVLTCVREGGDSRPPRHPASVVLLYALNLCLLQHHLAHPHRIRAFVRCGGAGGNPRQLCLRFARWRAPRQRAMFGVVPSEQVLARSRRALAERWRLPIRGAAASGERVRAGPRRCGSLRGGACGASAPGGSAAPGDAHDPSRAAGRRQSEAQHVHAVAGAPAADESKKICGVPAGQIPTSQASAKTYQKTWRSVRAGDVGDEVSRRVGALCPAGPERGTAPAPDARARSRAQAGPLDVRRCVGCGRY